MNTRNSVIVLILLYFRYPSLSSSLSPPTPHLWLNLLKVAEMMIISAKYFDMYFLKTRTCSYLIT